MPYKDIEKRRAKDRRYWAANRKARNEARRIFVAENPDRPRKWAMRFREKHGNRYWVAYKEYARDYARTYRAANPERARESVNSWRAANPGKAKAALKRRRVKLSERTPKWVDRNELNDIYLSRPEG